MEIALRDYYKTKHPNATLMQYLKIKYKQSHPAYKQSVYFHHDNSDVKKVIHRPIYELENVKQVNLYTFFSKVFKTIFNLINLAIKRNNKPLNVTLNYVELDLLFYNVYLDVYNKRNL